MMAGSSMVASRRIRPAQSGPRSTSTSKARRVSAAHLQNLVHQMRGPLGHPPAPAGPKLAIFARDALRQAGALGPIRGRAQGLRVELVNTAGLVDNFRRMIEQDRRKVGGGLSAL